MKPGHFIPYVLICSIFLMDGCTQNNSNKLMMNETAGLNLLKNYEQVSLYQDVSYLSENDKKIISLLIKASDLIDDIFWSQAIGEKSRVMDSITDENLKTYAKINYGTWDRLDNNIPFIDKFGVKPLGARFYPAKMTLSEFDKLDADDKYDFNTLISKKNDGSLFTIRYNQAYSKSIIKIVNLLNEAAELTSDKAFKKYLQLRAKAFVTDNYYESDLAWMENKTSNIDFIIGPIEFDEDRLLHAKAAHTAMLILKDIEWSKKLLKGQDYLEKLQKELPVEKKYKQETPLSNSDLGVYNVIYCTGDYNAGSKKISLTLPHDSRIIYEKGTRKLQFKNIMHLKFEKILKPIADLIVDTDQVQFVDFESFFENTMYYEVGNCLGCTNTINNKGTVKNALKEYYFEMQESKSDILSLFLITHLYETNIFSEKDIMYNYVTYLADIFRSMRFGIENPQARANIMRLNYFLEQGAIVINKETGKYRVDKEKYRNAITALAHDILVLIGDGNYDKAKKMIDETGSITPKIKEDLEKINATDIPKDIYFNQGMDVLGLNKY